MLRSPLMRILAYLFTLLLRVLKTSLKNVGLLLTLGGLYANIMNHFLFEIVSSIERITKILVSNSFILLTIRPSLI